MNARRLCLLCYDTLPAMTNLLLDQFTVTLRSATAGRSAPVFLMAALCSLLSSCGTTGRILPHESAVAAVHRLAGSNFSESGVSRGASGPATAISSARAGAPRRGDGARQALQLSLGSRQLDKALWTPTDEPAVGGVAFLNENPDTIGFEFGLSLGRDSESAILPGIGVVDADLQMLELSAGVRKTFMPEQDVQPFVGVGVSLVDVDYEVSVPGFGYASDGDSTFGVYAHAGVLFPINEQVRLGIDGRILRGTDGEIAGIDGDVDYEQVALILEFRF